MWIRKLLLRQAVIRFACLAYVLGMTLLVQVVQAQESSLKWSYARGNTNWRDAGLHLSAIAAALDLCDNYKVTHSWMSDSPTLGRDYEYDLLSCELNPDIHLSGPSWVATVTMVFDIYNNDQFLYQRTYTHFTVQSVCACDYGDVFTLSGLNCASPPKDCQMNPQEGNPVEIMTGRKTQKFVDYDGSGIKIVRELYQSGKEALWGFDLLKTAALTTTSNYNYLIVSNGATKLMLTKRAEDCWAHLNGKCHKVNVDKNNVVVEVDGVKEYYQEGEIVKKEFIGFPGLTQIYAYNDELVTVSSEKGTLYVTLNNQQNPVLIQTPSGILKYDYSEVSGKLIKATYLDESYDSFIYTNGEAGLLKELHKNGELFSFWQYDSLGRAVMSKRAGDKEATSFQYLADSVEVTNSLLKRTRYVFHTVGGVRVLKEVEGQASDN